MYTGLLHLHSLNKWLILIFGLLSIANALAGWLSNKPYTKTSSVFSLMFLITMHVQLLVGLVLFFVSPFTTGAMQDMGAAMKDTYLRYWAVEHTFAGLVAIILVTVGRVKAKKKLEDVAKHKTTAIFYILTMVLVLVNIAFPVFKFGRKLLPF